MPSMDAAAPIDCASFTTSWATCSAITGCGSAVAGSGRVSESESLSVLDMLGKSCADMAESPQGNRASAPLVRP